MLKIFVIFLVSASVGAATYDIAWDIPSDGTGVGGYELHHGESSGVYDEIVSISGYETDAASVSVSDGARFMALRSVGEELYSEFSNEILVGAEPAVAPTWGYLYVGYDAMPDPLYTYDFETLTAEAHNVGITSGLVGNAGQFNGVDSYVEMPNLDVSGEAITISAHISPEVGAISDARIVSKANSTSEAGHWWMLSLFSPNTVRFRLKTNGTTATLIGDSNVLVPGAWHQVKATYDGAFMKLFVDGAEVGSAAKTGAIDTNPAIPSAIGSQPQGENPFLGGIDEIEIYDAVLP